MDYRLSEIFDIAELRQLCESFTAINGTVTAILDLEGDVLIATGWQPICTMFHRRNPQTSALCTESDTMLASQLQQGYKYNIYRCKNGLLDVAMPIIVGGEHVGNFFTGQFFTEKPDIEYFRQQARKYGFDETAYLDALAQVPIFSEEQVKKVASFLVQLTEAIGNIGLRNLRNSEQARIIEIEKQNLKKVNDEYESLNREYLRINNELEIAKNRALESESTYRMLYNSINDALFATEVKADGTLGNFIMVNDVACQRLGYTREELLTKSPGDINSENSKKFLADRTRNVMENKKAILEIEHVTRDGRIIPTELCSSVYQFGDRTIIHTVARDITERKQAQRQLLLTGKSIEGASDAIFWVRPDASIVNVNEAAVRLLGYDRQELLRMRVIDFDENYNENLWTSHFEDLKQKGVLKFESFLTTKNGQCIPVEIVANYICFENEIYNCAFIRNITERKAAEKALRISEEDLKESQRIAHVGSWRLDIATNEVVWSEELYRMCDFDPSLPPPPYTEHKKLFTPESWEKLSVALAETAKTGTPYELELETVRNNEPSGWMWVYGKARFDTKGNIIGLFGAAQDITERKKVEAEIRSFNLRLEQMVQQRTEELNVKNQALEQTISQLRDTQSQLILFEKLTVLRHLISGIAHEINNPLGAIDSSRELICADIDYLVKNISRLSQWLSEPDGLLLTELICHAIENAGNCMAISSRDKRQIRSQIVEYLNGNGVELAQEVGEMLAPLNFHKELNKFIPLFRHNDVLEILRIITAIYDLYVACNTIRTAVDKSSKIVNALRGYVRKEGDWQNKVMADIREGMNNVLLLFQNTFKNFVTLELDMADDLPMIMCYPDQLNQVWTNIIQNALYAMKNTGKLTIEVKRKDNGVSVQVTDHGCGMTPEVKARMFEPLFTTKPAGEGMGLGMDIVHMIIVDRHNGRIDIDSELGKGTTVYVWLPIGEQ